MSNLQEASRPPVPLSRRPFTRFLRKILSQTLPSLYNKVDRLILTALVDLLEGEHRSELAILVPQLARRAGVSPASASRALGRLEAAGILTRRKKKLTQAGRYIWVLGLTQAYQVIPAQEDAVSGAPCHVKKACQGDAALSSPRTISVQDQHQATAGERLTDTDDELSCSRWDENPDDLEATIATLEEQWQTAPRAELLSSQPEPTVDHAPGPPCEAHPLSDLAASCADLPAASAPGEAASDQLSEAELRLRSVGIDDWKARQLAREHSLSLITRAIETLRYRAGTVRNPAAWIIRELERGGYAPPPTLEREEQRQARQAAQDRKREQEERQRAEEAEAQERERAQRLQGFHALAPERQAELLEQARSRLRRISPKLAAAPFDLERPGPLSAVLFELLEGSDPGPRISGPTPREGGWSQRRCDSARPVPTRSAVGCGAGPPT